MRRGCAIACTVACLLPVAAGCRDRGPLTNKASQAQEGPAALNPGGMILGKWRHERGNAAVTLDFTPNTVKWASSTAGSVPSGEGSYRVIDGKTLELPRRNEPGSEQVTVQSITEDKLVLSGGETWQFANTEFTRQKLAPRGSGGGEAARPGDTTAEPVHNGRPLSIWIKQLASPQEADRMTALDALGRLGPKAKAAVPALAAALKDKNGLLQPMAASALGRIGPDAKEAVPALIEALRSGGWASAQAAWALGKIGPEARPAVPALIDTVTGKVRPSVHGWHLPAALGELGPEAQPAVPALQTVLGQKQNPVRVPAALALWRIAKAPAAVTTLQEALKDKDSGTRVAAAAALWRIDKGPAALAALGSALQDPDAGTRAEAARTLGELGPEAKSFVPALTEALKDKDKHVRQQVARALGGMGAAASTAAPALPALLKDADLGVRLAAREALQRLGPAARGAVPALTALLRDQDLGVRLDAEDLLSRIDPEALRKAGS